MKVKENSLIQFSCIAHNFFGYDMFFLLKRIRLTVWQTQGSNIGGSGLSNINFPSLGSQVKFIDIIKYYPSSLGNLASTLINIEKKAHWKACSSISKPTRLFLTNVAFELIYDQKRKILDIIVSRTGVIPYEKNKNDG